MGFLTPGGRPGLRAARLAGLSAAVAAMCILLAACGSAPAPNRTVRGAVSAFNAALSRHDYAAACALLTITGHQAVLSEDGDATAHTDCAAAMRAPNVQQFLTLIRLTPAQIASARIRRPLATSAVLQHGGTLPRFYTLSRQHSGVWLISSL